MRQAHLLSIGQYLGCIKCPKVLTELFVRLSVAGDATRAVAGGTTADQPADCRVARDLAIIEPRRERCCHGRNLWSLFSAGRKGPVRRSDRPRPHGSI